MDKSSSESLPLDHPIHDFTRTDKTFTDESANLLTERMIADRLSAALASGNLDTLEQARQSFLDHHPAENLAPSLPSPVRTFGESEAERFRQEAEALKAAERELDLRRAEVQAARKRAEERAQLQAAEAERQRIAEHLEGILPHMSQEGQFIVKEYLRQKGPEHTQEAFAESARGTVEEHKGAGTRFCQDAYHLGQSMHLSHLAS